MEEIELGKMLSYIISGGTVISWSVWVTLAIFELKKVEAVKSQSDEDVKALITQMNDKIKSINDSIHDIAVALAKNNIDVK